MNAATHAATHSHETAVAAPKETSNVWWRRLGLLLIVGSAVLTYGGLYLAFR
jgi:hypothetical protein